MGTGSSVYNKVAGESKTFHVTVKDATDARPQSGPSYYAEVHVRDEASQFIDVMFICDEWGSSKGGLSTFNKAFAVNLAKAASDRIKVHCYVSSSSPEDKEDACKQGVNLITAVPRPPGSNDPMEWLKIPPPELPTPDVVVSHGRKFGSPAYFISKITKCKWLYFVHVSCEDMGKHKLEGRSTPNAIAEHEKKNRQELELCKAAGLAVAVGSRLQRKYSKSLRDSDVEAVQVEVITPGIFENFLTQASHVQPAEAEEFSIFMMGRGSIEDFALKGYDIVGKAVAMLGRKFELTFVGSPQDEQRRIEKLFLEKTNIARNQLTIRGYRDNKEMKKMFRQADVIVMPSRTEGFGLVALEAISAGVPVLVSSESGIAKALEKVEGGRTVVVDSDKPEDWAGRIKQLSKQKPKDRHASAMRLRDKYGEIYSWKKECERFEQMIYGLIQKPHKDIPLNFVLTDQTGNITVKVEIVSSAQGKGLVQTNRERNLLPDGTRALASPSSSESTEVDTSQEGDSATGATDANGATASVTSSESTKANSDSETDLGNSSVEEEKTTRNSLHSAAEAGDVAEIESLLALGFSVDRRDDAGRTPLMMAAVNDKLQAVQCLLKQGADPSLQNKKGWNVLHYASQGGNPESIELLLSHMLSIDLGTKVGVTPLMIAARNDKLQAVKCLLKQGADPSLQNNNGWNVLHHASLGGNPEVVELMLSHVSSIDSINKDGSTPLMIAAVNDKLQAVKCLLKQSADPSLQNNNGWNVLHCASQGGNPEVIELILSHVASIDLVTKVGVTPLMIAAVNDKLQAVKCLLKEGADPSLQDNDGWNVLHHASVSGNVAVMEEILSHGGDIESRTNSGQTSLMLAQSFSKSETVAYLLSKGAKSS